MGFESLFRGRLNFWPLPANCQANFSTRPGGVADLPRFRSTVPLPDSLPDTRDSRTLSRENLDAWLHVIPRVFGKRLTNPFLRFEELEGDHAITRDLLCNLGHYPLYRCMNPETLFCSWIDRPKNAFRRFLCLLLTVLLGIIEKPCWTGSALNASSKRSSLLYPVSVLFPRILWR